jgi:serine protease Do
VLVEQHGQGAAQRAADRAIQQSNSETDAIRAMLQRLLAGPGDGPEFSQSAEVPAEVVGADAATDIALLRVKAGRLPALRLGSSKQTSVGDAGIVSARGRTLADDPYIDFLQTDAAINRGNSGAPLLSIDGSVLGVTSVIFSPSGGSGGLGFAIPAETVASVISQLEAHGRVQRTISASVCRP